MSKFFNVVKQNGKSSKNDGGKFITPINDNYVQPTDTVIAPSNFNNGNMNSNYANMQNDNYMNGYNNYSAQQVNNQMNVPTGPVMQGYPNQVNNSAMNANNQYMQPVNQNMEVLDVLTEGATVNQEQLPPNPLNNANNPIPVNPVAPVEEVFVEEELPKNVKANIFSVIGMIFGMIFKPGTTIVSNAKKYRSTTKALFITFWITFCSLVLCIGARILVGSFSKTTNIITGATTINFNIGNIFNLDNYLEYLVIAGVVSFVAIMVVSLVYYGSSFLNSKGVPMGSYIMIANLSLLPFIIGIVILYPVAFLFSSYLAMAVLTFTFLYSLIALLIGVGRVLTFKNVDRQILYNVLNLSFIIMIMLVIVVLLIRANILAMPEISI